MHTQRDYPNWTDATVVSGAALNQPEPTRELITLGAFNDEFCGYCGYPFEPHEKALSETIDGHQLFCSQRCYEKAQVPFQFCDSCKSYHHPENPTCKGNQK